MKKFNRYSNKKRVMATILSVIMFINGLPVNIFAEVIKEIDKQVVIEFNGTTKYDNSAEIIDVMAIPNDTNIKVSSIQLPDGSIVEGDNAQYTAIENGKYKFTIFYEEFITVTKEVTEATTEK